MNETGRQCRQCKVFKTWDNFTTAKHTKSGHVSTCRPCMNERSKKYHRKKKGLNVLEGFSQKVQDFYLGRLV